MTGPIAIVCGAGYVSGKEVMALELAEGLRASGQRVICITSLWGNGDFVRRLTSTAIPFRRMRLGFISATLSWDALRMTADQLWRWPKLIFDYLIFLYKDKPSHVIHTNWHHLIMLWMFLDTRKDWFWLHELVPPKPQYRKVFGWLGRRINGFVTVSHATAASLRSIGIPAEKIHVIYNGLADPSGDTILFPPRVFGKNIGIVGQVGAWKGHEDLLEAFSVISIRHSTAVLHIFGAASGDFQDWVRTRSEEIGVASRMIWHGFVEKRENIYLALDICVIPSRCDESFGLTAVEAGYFGLPVIVARRGGLPEVVEDGVTGFVVESENSTQLAKRLDELLNSESLCKKMGAAARQRARQYFTRERLVSDFLRLLGVKNHVS